MTKIYSPKEMISFSGETLVAVILFIYVVEQVVEEVIQITHWKKRYRRYLALLAEATFG